MNSEIEDENGDESNELINTASMIIDRCQESGEKVKDEDVSKVLDDFAKEVYEAFKSNTNAQLFVYVLNMEEVNDDRRKAVQSFLGDLKNVNYVIYYFTKIENSPTVIPVPLNHKKLEELMNIFNKIKKSVKNLAENEAVEHGKHLYIRLTGKKEVLQPRDCNSSYGVWINCKDEDIDPLWEWLYTKSEDFFWGDKFDIVRIHRHCEISPCNVNRNVTILAGQESILSPDSLRTNLQKVVKCKIEIEYLQEGSDSELNISKDTHTLIIAGGIKISGKVGTNLNLIFTDNKILLLCPCMQLPLDLQSFPSVWIDSRFKPGTHAEDFVKCFFKVLSSDSGQAKVVEIVRKTRKKMQNDSSVSNDSRLWRLAYVVNGNPCTTLTA